MSGRQAREARVISRGVYSLALPRSRNPASNSTCSLTISLPPCRLRRSVQKMWRAYVQRTTTPEAR